MKNILISGGGTGGHLFAGIAIAEEMRRRFEINIVFVGSKRGIEANILPKRHEKVELLDVDFLRGKGTIGLFRSILRLPKAFVQAVRILRSHRIDLAIGLGGYSSGPAVFAAFFMGIPNIIVEQNAVFGLTNRILSFFTDRIYLSCEEVKSMFRYKSKVVGNPIRLEFVHACLEKGSDSTKRNDIVVLGGSQGSTILNDVVPRALAMANLRSRKIIHQSGEKMFHDTQYRYQKLGIEATVMPFIDNIIDIYRNAGVVIARAGASTISEIVAMGIPSILIPYPYAAGDHQRKNALMLEKAKASIHIPQHRLDPSSLVQALNTILEDNATMVSMSRRAYSIGQPKAAFYLVDDLCHFLHWKKHEKKG